MILGTVCYNLSSQVFIPTITAIPATYNTDQFTLTSDRILYIKSGALTTNGVFTGGLSTDTLSVTTTSTLDTLAVTNAATVGGTLGVVDNVTIGGTLVAINAATVGGTLGVTGLLTGTAISSSGNLFVNATSANDDPMVRLTSAAGLPQLVLEDLDATDEQEPFWYLQSANNGSAGRFYLGYADRSGTNLTGNADILVLTPDGLDLYGILTAATATITNHVSSGSLAVVTNATIGGTLDVTGIVTVDSITTTNGITDQSLTASLPVFSDGSKLLVSQTVATTKTLFGIQTGSFTVANDGDGTIINTFATAYASAPVVIVQTLVANIVTTNVVTATTTTTFTFDCGCDDIGFNYIAIGAP